jgi:hypothetical protein
MLPLPQSRREHDPVSGLVNCASYAAPDHAGERAAGSQLSVYPHCLISVSGFFRREKTDRQGGEAHNGGGSMGVRVVARVCVCVCVFGGLNRRRRRTCASGGVVWERGGGGGGGGERLE